MKDIMDPQLINDFLGTRPLNFGLSGVGRHDGGGVLAGSGSGKFVCTRIILFFPF